MVRYDLHLSRVPLWSILPALVVGILLQCFFDAVWMAIPCLITGLLLLQRYYHLPKLKRPLNSKLLIGTQLIIAAIGILLTYTELYQRGIPMKESNVLAKLESDPTFYDNTLSLTVRIHAERQYGRSRPVNQLTYLTIPINDHSAALKNGDFIRFCYDARKIKGGDEYFQTNFNKQLERHGIYYRQFIGPDQWEWVYKDSSIRQRILDSAVEFRDKIQRYINSLSIGESQQELLSALLIGNRGELSFEDKAAFSAAGVAHILAVSGLHTGIILGIILLLLYPLVRLRLSWLRWSSALILLWLYAFITGLAPSVIRAAIMASVWITGAIINRRSTPLNSLLLAAILMLVWNPLYLLNVGFQLSFLSVAGLLIIQPILRQWIQVKNHYLDKILEALCVSISTSIIVIPLSVFYFHQLPLLFLLTNLVLVPTLPVTISLGGLSVLTEMLSIPNEWIVFLTDSMLSFTLGSVRLSAAIPWGHIRIGMPDLFMYGYYATTTLLLLYYFRQKNIWLFNALGLVLLLTLFSLFTQIKNHLFPQYSMMVYNIPYMPCLIIDEESQQWVYPLDTTFQQESYIEKTLNSGKTIHIHNDTLPDQNHLYKHRYIHYRNMCGVFIDDYFSKELPKMESPLKCDFLLITSTFTGQLQPLSHLYLPRLIILAPNVHPSRASRLQRESAKLGWPCHRIDRHGSWKVEF